MKIDIYDGFIINPTVEVTPTIRISPFIEKDLNRLNVDIEIAKEYLRERFGEYLLTIKARDAISLALSYYDLVHDDVVTILTTSGNYYISSCVTREIEKYCLWSREITERTKIIFINHEFGYPCERLNELKKYNIPIIEDCAHSFISKDKHSLIGKIGDFVIYSLPKIFPMQIGGVLVSNKMQFPSDNMIPSRYQDYILKNLSRNIPLIDYIAERRLFNYTYLSEKLSYIGISPFVLLEKKSIPGVFLFKWEDNIDYNSLKIFMQNNGVESSVFYGKSAFYIPVHQQLDMFHLDYMITLLKYFKDGLC